MSKQLKIFNNSKKQFGGSLLIGKRKSRRPLSTKHPIHLVLRSNHKSCRAALAYGLSVNQKILNQAAEKFNIKIYDSVFNFTHVHMVIIIPSRESYIGFIRVLTAKLSRLAKLKSGQLFTLRPFTRIADWGRSFEILIDYLKTNCREAIGGVTFSYADYTQSWDDG
jgi:REP element-mobilizing transposase RayT